MVPNDEPIDLSPLAPDVDSAAADRFVASVLGRIETAGLRPSRGDLASGIGVFARPVLLAASVAIAIAGSIVIRARIRHAGPATVAQSLGVPPDFERVLAERGARAESRP